VLDDFLFPRPPEHPDDPEGIVSLDPLLERRLERDPWKVRSAQWRAWALAEIAFGGAVRVGLTGRGGYETFRGLLNLTVPFRGLEDHRDREALFLAWAQRDPVLSRVPLVFVFEPEPVSVS